MRFYIFLISLLVASLNTAQKQAIGQTFQKKIHHHALKNKQYELTNHLGNVLTIINDNKTPTNNQLTPYVADIQNTTDYSPFGNTLHERSYVLSKKYRYGFQNQESDSEIKGEGNTNNYKYRINDSRLGRFFTIDPLHGRYPSNSTYAFSENRVINAVELEGLEAQNAYHFNWNTGGRNTKTTLASGDYASSYDRSVVTYSIVQEPFSYGARMAFYNGGMPDDYITYDTRLKHYTYHAMYAQASGLITPVDDPFTSGDFLIVPQIIKYAAKRGLFNGGKLIVDKAFQRKIGMATPGGKGAIADDLTMVNHSILTGEQMGMNNCINTSISTYHTLKGDKVGAMPYIRNQAGEIGDYMGVYKDLEEYFGSTFASAKLNEIKSTLKPGQQGIVVGAYHDYDIMHAFNAINDNGVIKFVDGQSGEAVFFTTKTATGEVKDLYSRFWFLKIDDAKVIENLRPK